MEQRSLLTSIQLVCFYFFCKFTHNSNQCIYCSKNIFQESVFLKMTDHGFSICILTLSICLRSTFYIFSTYFNIGFWGKNIGFLPYSPSSLSNILYHVYRNKLLKDTKRYSKGTVNLKFKIQNSKILSIDK